jgi:hypothetical protein
MAGAVTFSKAISGNDYKNVGGTIVKAGNKAATSPITNDQTLRANTLRIKNMVRPELAVSPTASGNIGVGKPVSGGTFAYVPPFNVSSSTPVTVIARRVSTTISGASNEALKSGASDTGIRKAVHTWKGDRTYNNTANTGATFDIFGNLLTKGTDRGAAGDQVPPSGIDGTTGHTADHTVSKATFAIPGELVLLETGKTPSQKDYEVKYSP